MIRYICQRVVDARVGFRICAKPLFHNIYFETITELFTVRVILKPVFISTYIQFCVPLKKKNESIDRYNGEVFV